MAGPSAGERLIGWYGSVAEKNLSARPGFVRTWLMLGFQAMRGKVHLAPYGDLVPSGNHGYRLFMDSVVGALADFDNAVVTSIFTPNEIFHALGARPVTAEAVASFASGAQAEGGFIAAAEGRGVPETYCSYHRILMGMAGSGVLGKPRMLASCSVACDANNLTFKTLGRYWGVPHVYVDVPYDVSRDSVLYVADELREMAHAAEDAFSRKLDEER
ncbi:MAG: 2-hydroxyacyl-CoA dehydratase family protein, partial [Coriobacteriaceae bacterium]|nr:2-hydroxyacyl-CoA dehydratase family protein [Coriobacteriaceae bacterium]